MDGCVRIKHRESQVNTGSCISVASFIRSIARAIYRRICLHQHLLFLPQRVVQMEQCKRCAMHSVNTDTCLRGKRNNINRLQTGVERKKNFEKKKRGGGDEICRLLPNGTRVLV